jgi:hypothetical protein
MAQPLPDPGWWDPLANLRLLCALLKYFRDMTRVYPLSHLLTCGGGHSRAYRAAATRWCTVMYTCGIRLSCIEGAW